jgi:hypothetical protein
MSLDQRTYSGRHVIDLTNGPVIDLTKAAYYSADRAELAEAANRLLLSRADVTTDPPARYADRFALPTPPRPAASNPALAAMATLAPARSRSLQIDLLAVTRVSAMAALVMLLIGVVASVLY